MHRKLSFGLNLIRFLATLSLCLSSMGCGTDQKLKSGEFPIRINKMEPAHPTGITERYGKSLRSTAGNVPVLVLRGDYEELGEAQGALAGKEIIYLLDKILIPSLNQAEANVWDSRVLPAAGSFVFPARYDKELSGMIRGIEKRYPDKFDRMLFSIGREINIDDLRALNCFIDMTPSGGGCSSFSAWGSLTQSGEVICGRNMDERYIAGKVPFMIVAREPAESNRQASIELTCPGLVGVLTAMNKDGLILMAHHEQGLQCPAAGEWLPRSIVFRDVIESVRAGDSVDQIVSSFKDRPVRTGNNTHIARPAYGNAKVSLPFVLEWDGNSLDHGVSLRNEDPSVARDAIVCTNHFVTRRHEELAGSRNSRMRFQILADSLRKYHDSKETISVEKAIRMMDSVARSGEVVTYFTVIAIPGEKRIVFAVSPGRGISATREEWIEITWDLIFGMS